MQNIPIELAAPDMVLAKEVKREDNANGPPVCGRGVTLTRMLVERLKTMNIRYLCVEGHPVWMEGDKPLEEQLEGLDRRFKKVEDDPLMSKVKKIYRAQLIRAMGGQDE